MSAVVSNRVKARPKDKLRPGATEVEFAYLKVRRIRAGLDSTEHGPYFSGKYDPEILQPNAER